MHGSVCIPDGFQQGSKQARQSYHDVNNNILISSLISADPNQSIFQCDGTEEALGDVIAQYFFLFHLFLIGKFEQKASSPTVFDALLSLCLCNK